MIRRATLRCLTVGACLGISLTAAPAGAEWFRLSQGQAFSDVFFWYEISPDRRWAVYMQDAVVDGRWDLWSVAVPAGTPVKLNGLIPTTGGSIPGSRFFEISPDSTRVAYMIQSDFSAPFELYSVPIGGPASAAVKLNGPISGDLGIGRDFRISPDGDHVVYRADQDSDQEELYSVPIAGPASAGVKLNRPLPAGGEVLNFQISSDGSRVVYVADQATDGVFELYSVPIAGPASSGVKLNRPLPAGGRVQTDGYEIGHNGGRVVYAADQDIDDKIELYSVPIAGPASSGVKLNGPLVPGGRVFIFQISSDDSRVVYRATQDDIDFLELYSVPIAGPASSGVKLNGPLIFGRQVQTFLISPDSSRVVYESDQHTDDLFELFSVPIAGPASSGFKLNGPFVAGGEIENFTISPDSTWVVYAADREIDGWPMGYRAPLDGPPGSDERIWATAVALPAPRYAILADSSAVVVHGNSAFVDSIRRLWTYPLAGAPDWQGTDWLGGEIQRNGAVESVFRLLPDGSGALYAADQAVDGRFDLYVLYFRIWGDGFETGDLSRWSDVVP